MAGLGSDRAIVDEINITPLTDVFLVLLIIMMVVAPMVQLSKERQMLSALPTALSWLCHRDEEGGCIGAELAVVFA